MTDKTPDFEPPLACVNRVIKGCLAENTQITKDARASFTRAAGIFIFYITHCANDFAKDAKRSTISSQDILAALKELEFEDFIEPLEHFLTQYRNEAENENSNPKKKIRIAQEDSGNTGTTIKEETKEDNENDEEEEDILEDDEATGMQILEYAEEGEEEGEAEGEAEEEDSVQDGGVEETVQDENTLNDESV